jgi:hypothetical protein
MCILYTVLHFCQSLIILFHIIIACLDEINEKINCEDSRTRPLRRALIFMDILNKVNDH